MTQHFEAVEADFQSHYGLDLRDLLWGDVKVGARRLLSLVKGLPPRGALARTVNSKGADWSTLEELVATLVEQTDLSNRLFVQANSEGNRAWEPLRVNRPTAETTTKSAHRKPSSTMEMKSFFGRAAQYIGNKGSDN